MSFVTEEDVQDIVEGLMRRALEGRPRRSSIPRPFQRLTYAEAMGKYGSDKPDLRFDLPLVDLTEVVTRHDGGGVGLLQSAVETAGGIVKGWRLPAAQAKSAVARRSRQARGVRQGVRRPRPGARARRRRRRLGAEPDEDDDRRACDAPSTRRRGWATAICSSCSSAPRSS